MQLILVQLGGIINGRKRALYRGAMRHASAIMKLAYLGGLSGSSAVTGLLARSLVALVAAAAAAAAAAVDAEARSADNRAGNSVTHTARENTSGARWSAANGQSALFLPSMCSGGPTHVRDTSWALPLLQYSML